MKSSKLLPLAATVALSSCAQIASTINEPITSDYNPLDGPNVALTRNKSFQPTGPSYQPGQWVETAMPSSTFFYKIPKGNATADQVLSKGAPLKVISTKGSYVKVELEGGSVGFVPTIMVAEPSSSYDDTPFLPTPPSQPLQRSNDSLAPPSLPSSSVPSAAPLPASESVIPPPPGYSGTSTPSAPSLPSAPSRGSTEVIIPTTPSPVPSLAPAPTAPNSIIPAPIGGGKIDQTIGIELRFR